MRRTNGTNVFAFTFLDGESFTVGENEARIIPYEDYYEITWPDRTRFIMNRSLKYVDVLDVEDDNE